MVKKLKYLLFFIPFLFTLNVNAMLLGTPNSYAYFNDDSITGPSNATSVGWWGTNNYYKSPYLMGGVSSGSWVRRIDFNWNNANLCPNDDISISGSIGGLYNLFTEQSTSLVGFNNGVELACVTSIQENGSRLDYSCYGKGGGTLSFYVFMNSYSLVKQYEIGITKNMTVSCDASNLDVIQNATANTNSIINNNNQNTNTIVDNDNQNTDKIIDNQKELLGSDCSNLIDLPDFSLNKDNNRTYNYVFPTTLPAGTYTLSYKYNSTGSPSTYAQILLNSSSKLDLNLNSSGKNTFTINSDFNRFYILISSDSPSGSSVNISNIMLVNGSSSVPYCKYGSTVSKLDQTTGAINDLNDSITSEGNPNTNQDINDMNNMVASDTPISDLITMPLTLINAYIGGIGSTCSPVNLGSLLGTNLTIPCINIQQHIGSNLWNTIDILCCIFLCYEIAMLFISAFDGITSLRDDFEGLYQPKHAYTGYVAKHGGGN